MPQKVRFALCFSWSTSNLGNKYPQSLFERQSVLHLASPQIKIKHFPKYVWGSSNNNQRKLTCKWWTSDRQIYTFQNIFQYCCEYRDYVCCFAVYPVSLTVFWDIYLSLISVLHSTSVSVYFQASPRLILRLTTINHCSPYNTAPRSEMSVFMTKVAIRRRYLVGKGLWNFWLYVQLPEKCWVAFYSWGSRLGSLWFESSLVLYYGPE